MILKKSKRILSILLILALAIPMLPAQVRPGSPYSRFGIGDLHRLSNARNLSMGGVSIALRDKGGINYSNPASYTAFDSLSFIFEGGMINHYASTRTNELQATNNYISLGYLLFGFPVTEWWRASFGLLPFSDVGYNIIDQENHPQAGSVDYLFKGQGGINQMYFGSGFRLHPKLSAGINVAYLFGTLEKSRAAYFADTSFSQNLRIANRTHYGDLLPSFGLQFHEEWKNDHYFTAGMTYGPQTALKVSADQIAETFTTGSSGLEFIKDTVSNLSGQKGKVVFPAGFGSGLTYGKKGRWEVSAEFRMQNWEAYRYFDIRDSLKNSFQLATGFFIIPDPGSISSYWERLTYRAGIRYGSSYLQLRDKQISEIGISFGMGLPLRRSQSMLNLGVEYGRRGTLASDLIQENFFRVVIGVSVYERWFQQRRYE
jgi:hypothetical protein